MSTSHIRLFNQKGKKAILNKNPCMLWMNCKKQPVAGHFNEKLFKQMYVYRQEWHKRLIIKVTDSRQQVEK